MVAVLRVGERVNQAAPIATSAPGTSVDMAQQLSEFNQGFIAARQALRQDLLNIRQSGRKIAVFGAGHHAVKYINFYGLADLIQFVVDDNPVKSGLFVAGTDLQVRPSSGLEMSGITLCLSSLNPATEANVRRALPAYVELGGEFRPIFRTSREIP